MFVLLYALQLLIFFFRNKLAEYKAMDMTASNPLRLKQDTATFFWIITIHPLLSILVALCFSLYVCTGGQLVLAFTSRWRCWLSKLVFSEGMVSPSLEWKWIEVWLMGYSSPMSAWSLHCYMLISISASKSVKLSFTGWKLHVLFWLLVVCVVRNLYSISM